MLNQHTLCGLKQHKFILFHFWSQKLKKWLLVAVFFLEALGSSLTLLTSSITPALPFMAPNHIAFSPSVFIITLPSLQIWPSCLSLKVPLQLYWALLGNPEYYPLQTVNLIILQSQVSFTMLGNTHRFEELKYWYFGYRHYSVFHTRYA